jgi:hypothetical protein
VEVTDHLWESLAHGQPPGAKEAKVTITRADAERADFSVVATDEPLAPSPPAKFCARSSWLRTA